MPQEAMSNIKLSEREHRLLLLSFKKICHEAI